MLLGEPPPTQADLHFRIFGIPVRVHPFFWLVSLLLGMGGGEADPLQTLIWVVVVFVSILVHELGHAFTQRNYGGHPWITLYSFGGLASCDDCDRSPSAQILISLAGPAAGFLLAALVVAAVWLNGHTIGFAASQQEIDMSALSVDRVLIQPLLAFVVYFEPFQSQPLNYTIADLLQVNVLWGLVNLLPIYPLDGGRIARELFTLRNPRYGVVQSLQLSAGAAVLVAAYALLNQRIFMCLMFGFLAYGNFQTLQFYRSRWR
ncbi:MAG: site-2 protease family protein [Pirellulales bacterium]